MNRKFSVMALGLLFFVTLACQSDPFEALAAKEERQMEEALGGHNQVVQRAIVQQKQIDSPRYPDFSGATPLDNDIWDCSQSSYGGSQYWTASGPQAIFACDALGNAYMRAGEEAISNPAGFDDELIGEFKE